MKPELFPVILAGGSGTRLWPLSRKNFPKQFLRLQSESSLLQQTMQRTLSLPHTKILTVSNEAHYFLCQEQLQSFQTPITYLLEPCVRNTAPAIAVAAHYLVHQINPHAIMLILPSDHWIADEAAWRDAMLQGIEFATSDSVLVTFGIKPSGPKTGYGYIEAIPSTSQKAMLVQRFREKPDVKTAEEFIANGHYYWNSGMFVCRAQTYLDELHQHAPDIFQASKQAILAGQYGHDYIRLDAEAFAQCRSESIDYAIMEKTSKAAMIAVDIQWSDLGCWTAVAEANPLDANGNALHGKVIAKDSHNCLVSSEDILVTTIGIQDQIIVATTDAVLVADKQYSQQVKDIVQALGENHAQLADEHTRVSRPWGYYEILAEGPAFKVKRLMVKPGAKLSLQMHEHRAEHWVIVGGLAEVTNDEQIMQLTVNQSTYIPQKTRHRLCNPGNEPLYVIEVQSGHYLGEDDIIRFDDVYQRKTLSTSN
ncbi:mannose-1-phosphate guanylyltransferase/mannose-6-phosphate isomerase [Legionella oakridgensis]|uniref:mannose-1-phosphate guanylyltransferase n=2 Tax=Legionella oakridgensis TaxID=29423 RepID=W0BJ68_9GAMM|nr:mannose-1-phosphate guanylyltransferase/mannose-6-phosphate isomerase [Legionella oakridgensis]AHE68459.1 mannose-1-phosphate guanylyltransferase/mannose-6-phosphate isomerase [Legionella oakridgensis ATCC 33761 = DSM 21215]ETO92126.1 mannose-1-phosphate guanylyltransferase/mannose-6-phosphate isomerase [Legionella oakridgensis RV-2-2007]KTD38387.1 phosphomannose isomerase GDP mannose pyrophosphorylase [Legionella oakridgensis]STY21396.1 phosphomannose isomerase GDP mannose pyrophosphorylase